MKIETHLSPNCSESAFVVVDWNKRKIIDDYDCSSDGIDKETVRDFISGIQDYIADGYDIQQLDSKSGDGFHPEIVAALKELHKKKLVLNTKDTARMTAMAKELIDSTDDKIEETMLKYVPSKAELLASGYYGRKK